MESQKVTNPNISVNLTPITQLPTFSQTKSNVLVPILLTLVVSGVIFGFGGYYFGSLTVKNINEKVNLEPTQVIAYPTPISSNDQIANHLTAAGYQNHELGFSLDFPKTWQMKEKKYIGQAKYLVIQNKELDIAIGIAYMEKGADGQTGPTGMAGEMVKQGTILLSDKKLDKYFNMFKDEKGVNGIDLVYFSDPGKDRGLEFIIRLVAK